MSGTSVKQIYMKAGGKLNKKPHKDWGKVTSENCDNITSDFGLLLPLSPSVRPRTYHLDKI